MENTKNSNDGSERHSHIARKSSPSGLAGKRGVPSDSTAGGPAGYGEGNGWVKGVRLVDQKPSGPKELAFVRKVKSRNFVILEEVRYQAEGDSDVRSYWAKSVREPDREHRTINAQAMIAQHLRRFQIEGIWQVKHYLELESAAGETYHMILSETLPSGKTLFQRIYDAGKGTLKENRALHIIGELSQTVQALHDAGVFHWDISSKNIWVTDQGAPILFDWDFAFKNVEEFLERKLWRCGTPHYLSRERLEAMERGYESSECTLRTDEFASHEVYSLISVLTHMLIGNEFLKYGNHFGIPYNEHESLGQVLNDRGAESDGISPWLRSILVQTFTSGKSPFDTANEFLGAIRANGP